jgi:hypothetical protein
MNMLYLTSDKEKNIYRRRLIIKMKKVLLSVLLLVVSLVLIGCSEPVTLVGETYGPGHSAVAYAMVKTDEAGKILEADFQEYFLPEEWAVVTATQEVEGLVVAIGGKYYAQYVSIDGEIFEVANEGNVAVYKNSADKTVMQWAETVANAKKYVEACKTGKAFVSDSEGVKNSTYHPTDIKWTKIDKGYWPAGNNKLGYQANVNKLLDFVKGKTISANDSIIKNSSNIWTVNDAVTGATNNDFALYYNLLVTAYENRA